MNRIPGLMYAAQRSARWALPWLGVLAISAMLAYATTVGMAAQASAANPAATGAVAQALDGAVASGLPGWSAATIQTIDRDSRPDACDMSGGRLLYVGLNNWMPAEPMVAPCPQSLP
jgi:hypothetical protein